MRIAVINVPLREPEDPSRWITVPPGGYGGIQWVVAHLVDGLITLGHTVYLLGAPGSPSKSTRMRVVEGGDPYDIERWLTTADVDIVHDHSNGAVPIADFRLPFVSTHHLTGAPRIRRNAIYLSYAHRADAGSTAAPVIRLPVNVSRHRFSETKDNFLLSLSRVSPWKGVREAAGFAAAANLPLMIAGPSWEPEYLQDILSTYPDAKYLGEVGGNRRLELLAHARALLVLSQPVAGPWGGRWCEPGATVVSEAAASGTPVIATSNGCLGEIAGHVGVVLEENDFTQPAAHAVLASLPSSASVRAAAKREWDYVKIAAQYVDVYGRVMGGTTWDS